MNFIRTFSLLFACFAAITASAQHPLDKLLSGSAPTLIGDATDGLSKPFDLDFCRAPGRTDELWVLNRESGSSSMSIFFHAGTPDQISQYRKDSHNGHFMVNASGFAMAANGNFSTVQEVLNSVGGTTNTFMGPTLWTSDTSVFARMYQSDWDPSMPLGSHIDMLHQSPYSMGIASEKDNIYWVFDGYHGNLVRYDFAIPHSIGGDDHSDGQVWRYPEVKLTRIPKLPGHMVLDTTTGWLYIVDNARTRILRVNTKTGVKARDLQPKDEPLALYWEMKNVTWEVYIDTGLTAPVGIDYWNGRLVVTDNANGTIRLYDATGAKGLFLGALVTNASSIMGIKIGPDSNLWFVDAGKNTITKLSPADVKTPSIPVLISPVDNATNIADSVTLVWAASQDATQYQLQLSKQSDFATIDIDVDSLAGLSYFISSLVPNTTYYWHVRAYNELTNSNWSPAWRFTTATSSVRDQHDNITVSIFPNPMRATVTVSYTLSRSEGVAFEVVNALGVSVLRGSLNGKVGMNEFTVERGGLPAGSYLLRIRIEDKVYTRSIVILP